MFIYMKIVGNTRGMSLLSFAGDSHRSWCVCQLASFPVNILGFSNGSVCYFIDNYLKEFLYQSTCTVNKCSYIDHVETPLLYEERRQM